MGDYSPELFEIRAICDVAAEYAVNTGDSELYTNDPRAAYDRLSIMIQLIQKRVAALESALDE